MRGGKVLVALALTVGTAAVWFSGDAPANGASTQEGGWQFETTKPASSQAGTQSPPSAFTWSSETDKQSVTEPNRLRRTQTAAARRSGSARPVRESSAAVGRPSPVRHASLNQRGTSGVTQVSFQEPRVQNQKPAAPSELPDFGDLSDDAFRAPSVPARAESSRPDSTPAPAAAKTPTNDVNLFESGDPASLFAPLDESSNNTTAVPARAASVRVESPATPALSAPPVRRPVATPPAAADVATTPDIAAPRAVAVMPAQPVASVLDMNTASPMHAAGGPFVSVKFASAEKITVGRECKCTLTVRNEGSGIAGNVILEAYAPKTVRIASTNPQTAEEGTLTWSLGEIEAGEEKSVQVALVPTASGALNVRSFVRYSAQTTTMLQVVEPMLKVNLAGPESAQVGEAAPYVITVSNPGSGVADNVVISARIPKGLEHRRGSMLNMQIGSLNPGESRTVRLALTAIEPGDQPIQIAANADGELTDKAGAMVAVVAPMLNLEIQGPAIRHAGRRGKYSIRVSNPGNIATSNVRAKYRVPTGFEFIEADRGGRVAADGSIEWFVGQVAPGESSEFSVTLKARKLGNYTHQAGVVSEHGAAKSAQLPTRVEGVASLAITILDRDDPVEVGQETLYEVRVANEGSRDARSVVLTCELPAGMKVTAVRGPVNYVNRDGRVVFEPLETLAVGKTSVYQLVVTATQGGSQRLRARLTSDSVRDPLISEELTKVYAD